MPYTSGRVIRAADNFVDVMGKGLLA